MAIRSNADNAGAMGRGDDAVDGQDGVQFRQRRGGKGDDRPHVNFAVVGTLMMGADHLPFAQQVERCVVENDLAVGVTDIDDGDAARRWKSVVCVHAMQSMQ